MWVAMKIINLITRNMLTFPVLLSIWTFRGAPRLSAVSEIKTRKKDGLKQLHKCHKKVRSGKVRFRDWDMAESFALLSWVK